jgi:transposase-like protein
MWTSNLCIAGTIFRDTRKPLKNGTSAKGLQQVLGLKSYKTVWAWMHKTGTAMVVSDRHKQSGIVEPDETYLGESEQGRKRGRGSENNAVIAIAVEAQGKLLGRIRMNIREDVTSGSLQGFIKCAIEPGATLVTDTWRGYSGIETEGYSREIINRSNAENDEEMLPLVHMIVSLLNHNSAKFRLPMT